MNDEALNLLAIVLSLGLKYTEKGAELTRYYIEKRAAGGVTLDDLRELAGKDDVARAELEAAIAQAKVEGR